MDEHEKQVTFTIDGEPFTVDEKHESAAELLRSAGLDPAQYDLAEIKQNGETKTFADDHEITVKDGDEFVSVRQSAPVA